LYDYKKSRTLEEFSAFAKGGYLSAGAQDIPKRNDARTQPEPKTTQTAERSNDERSNVVVLTAANFEEKTKTGKWLVEFYSPRCGHCKRLEPVWEELATKAKQSFLVGKVDCTVNQAICSKFQVRGYPTIKL
jgi:thioredoxin-like negative regulator of GroEL